MTEAITIRLSTNADATRIAELAELDARPAPVGPALLAEVDGELQAAVGIDDGRAVADPFRFTDDVVRLLRLRATGERPRRGLSILRWLSTGHALGREGVAA
jgi:hypothetical protein